MGLKGLSPWGRESEVPIRLNNHWPNHDLWKDLKEIKNLLNKWVWGRHYSQFPAFNQGFEPLIRIAENDRELKIVAELPGFNETDLQLDMYPDRIIIQSLKNDNKTKNRFIQSFAANFRQEIFFNCTSLKTDAVKAIYKDGMLRITLPKSLKRPHRFR